MREWKRKGILTKLLIAALDAVIVLFSFGLALWVRFDFRINTIPAIYKTNWLRFVPYQIMLTIAIFALLHMYRYVWHTVGLKDVLSMVGSVIAAFAVSEAVLVSLGCYMPTSVVAIALVLQMGLFIAMRCTPRILSELAHYYSYVRHGTQQRIMLIGGGSAGRAIVQELSNSGYEKGRVCCIIDDNPAKCGKIINGVPIVGGRDKITEYAQREQINQIILAIPSIQAENKKELLHICGETGIPTKTLPSILQLVNGQVRVSDLKDVQIEDLLGRDVIRLDLRSLHGFLGGSCVMVTGGGGSIGSEICRQIARYNPRELIILDIYENNAYEIQQELRRSYGYSLNVRVEIASVRDAKRLDELFARYHPDIVFHAAAHKHVPLMEDCPTEAVKNNIFGTYHVITTAEKYGVKKFVMISTDKAVNPTNVMGATKRYCEMIVQSFFASPMECCSVRFGNVLGSNGSVVPLFRKQIKEGGPVTITDKRITRFFMTIPEAVQLVLEAGAMAKQGQIFVLDMGEPVKILDLAEKMILLSGLEPYQDIDIQEIGLRPGEKLYEELLMQSNDLSSTGNKKIFVEQQHEISKAQVKKGLSRLKTAIQDEASEEELTALLHELIPTYVTPDEVNQGIEEKCEYQAPKIDEVTCV